MESSVTIKGQITLPAALRRRFGLVRGRKVTFAATRNGILVKPAKVTVQDLTRKPAWKKAFEESVAQAERGETKVFANSGEFTEHLKSLSKKKTVRRRIHK